ncbi:hypothetical protein [Arthrobacter woluwensis]|uniref:Uncharacterized protein n=1 Tax=Arthrobacter woluwensis TaxID=156980 RepID=A0A1H4I7U1_9MICC|nr:hypothetical protein [Arthrobacter woluwensis]SEB30149.1 hypothetical protein SAMN04489745_0114 [Arthrobacter woluwensis]
MFVVNPLIATPTIGAVAIPAKVFGDDLLAPLRQFSGQILAGCVVLVVGGIALAIVLWSISRTTELSKAQRNGMTVAVSAIIAGAVLGSLNALVGYGSTLGQDSLMPPAARQPSVDITKAPAKSTCTNTVDLKYGTPADDATLRTILGSKAEQYITDGWMKVQWTPTGPDCTSGNHTPDPCSSIQLTTLKTAGAVTRPENITIDPATSCKK